MSKRDGVGAAVGRLVANRHSLEAPIGAGVHHPRVVTIFDVPVRRIIRP